MYNTKEELKNIITNSKLNDLSELCYKEMVEKGWHTNISLKDIKFGDYISNLHAEVSELFEAYRKDQLFSPCDKSPKMLEQFGETLTYAEEEISDILIRLLDTAKVLNVDIEKAIYIKTLYNRTRELRNGGKIC